MVRDGPGLPSKNHVGGVIKAIKTPRCGYTFLQQIIHINGLPWRSSAPSNADFLDRRVKLARLLLFETLLGQLGNFIKEYFGPELRFTFGTFGQLSYTICTSIDYFVATVPVPSQTRRIRLTSSIFILSLICMMRQSHAPLHSLIGELCWYAISSPLKCKSPNLLQALLQLVIRRIRRFVDPHSRII